MKCRGRSRTRARHFLSVFSPKRILNTVDTEATLLKVTPTGECNAIASVLLHFLGEEPELHYTNDGTELTVSCVMLEGGSPKLLHFPAGC